MVCLNFKLSVPRSSVLTTKVTLEKNVFFRALPIYFYKLLTDIIASKYLSMCVQVKRASDLWKETNSQALDRLARLRGVFAIQHHEDVNLIVFFFLPDNQAAWERYEQKRDELFKKLDGADTELENINQVNCVFPVPAELFILLTNLSIVLLLFKVHLLLIGLVQC